jgi:glycosyltransferase involved in cell wall biosynthesis
MRTDLASLAGPSVEIINLNVIRTLSTISPLYQLLQERRPGVLISALTHSNIVCTLVAKAARSGTRVIVTEHGQKSIDPRLMEGLESLLLPHLAGFVYGFADEIVAVSKGLSAYMDGMFFWQRNPPVRVVYNPVVREVPPRPVSPPHPWLEKGNPPVIVGIGRLEYDKNFPLLMRAFARFTRNRAARLIILGEGPDRRALESLAADLGITESLLLPGFVYNVNDWLQHAATFVCPSLFEGFGNAIVEAMACGMTVISTDCPYGPSEILEHGRYGYLVPIGDADAIAEAMAKAIDHPLDPATIRNRAAMFSFEQSVNHYADMIRNLRMGA